MGQYKRSHYLINRKMQVKYAILTVCLLVLYTMVLLAAIFAPHIVVLFSDMPLQVRSQAADALLVLHKSVWPAVGLIIALFGVLSIYITHRIAGPVYVFERMTNSIANGNLTVRVKLRKGDDLNDLATDLNKMADHLEHLLINLDGEYKKLSGYVDELKNELEAKHISEQSITSIAAKIEKDKDEIKDILEKYSYSGKSISD